MDRVVRQLGTDQVSAEELVASLVIGKKGGASRPFFLGRNKLFSTKSDSAALGIFLVNWNDAGT